MNNKELEKKFDKQWIINVIVFACIVGIFASLGMIGGEINELEAVKDSLDYECIEYSERVMWTFKSVQGEGTIHLPLTVNGTPRICQNNNSCQDAIMTKTCIKYNVVKR